MSCDAGFGDGFARHGRRFPERDREDASSTGITLFAPDAEGRPEVSRYRICALKTAYGNGEGGEGEREEAHVDDTPGTKNAGGHERADVNDLALWV